MKSKTMKGKERASEDFYAGIARGLKIAIQELDERLKKHYKGWEKDYPTKRRKNEK